MADGKAGEIHPEVVSFKRAIDAVDNGRVCNGVGAAEGGVVHPIALLSPALRCGGVGNAVLFQEGNR